MLATRYRQAWAACRLLALALALTSCRGKDDGSSALARKPPFPWPAFSLGDEGDKAFTPAQLLGRPWLAHFVALSCGDSCSRGARRLLELQRRLRDRGGPPFDVVSLSIDASDGVAALARFRKSVWSEDPAPEWHLLRADDRTTPAMAVAVGAAQSLEAARWGMISPNAGLFVVDPAGQVVRIYPRIDDETLKRVEADLRAMPNVNP